MEQSAKPVDPTPGIFKRISSTFWRDLDKPQDIVQWFMPSWFTVSMGSGILANCIGRIPYESYALWIFGAVIFFLNIGLFSLFLSLQIWQLVAYPGIIQYMRSHPRRLLHYGAIPMSLATIVSGNTSYGFGNTTALCLFGWTLWWISSILAAAASMLLICLIISREISSAESVTGAWLLLVAPLAVCAAAGASIAELLPNNSQALLTLLTSYCLLGAGAPLTGCIVVLYIYRITVHKLPPHDAIITAFIPLGPIGQIGVAALSLGDSANVIIPETMPLMDGLGTAMLYLGIILALLSWGFSVFWTVHAILSVIYQRRSAAIPFNISWWALTFPMGVFAILTCMLADTMDLWYFRVQFMVLVAILLALWLFNMARTIAGVWTGAMFGIRPTTPKFNMPESSISNNSTVYSSDCHV
ncbi:Plasma membrane sulfite pump involved in sulfite metabolism [Coemansia sp. RSA 988]|nr:Plasma membrane sulfite pump involved in sulfite metabolism [Coemansia sp. RSA 988]